MSNYEFASSCLLTISIKSAAGRLPIDLECFWHALTPAWQPYSLHDVHSHPRHTKRIDRKLSSSPLKHLSRRMTVQQSHAITIQCMGEECKKSKLPRNYVPVSSSNFHSEWQPEFPDHLPINPASGGFLLFSCVPFTSSASSVCIRVHPPPPALVESPSCGVDLSSIALSSPIHALGHTWHDHWNLLWLLHQKVSILQQQCLTFIHSESQLVGAKPFNWCWNIMSW